MKKLLSTLLLLIPLTCLSQGNLRDSIFIKNDIFELVYSEKLEQPKYIKYEVSCYKGTIPRTGLDFYTCDSIKTSDNKDYENNPYDKGHLAPAADFNCNKETLIKTFTYLNCSLQQQDLNRGAWRLLELHERELLSTNKSVLVEIRCVFSKTSLILPTGATVPDGYYKIITYGKTKETYYFKNEKPTSNDYTKFKIPSK